VDEEQFQASALTTVAVLKAKLGIKSSDTVLEIGCGVGRIGRELAPLCRKWIGTDISGNMLRYCRSRLESCDNVTLVQLGGVGLAEIPTESADVVYCTVVFMHLYEWDRYRYVQEAFRVLRQGGRCYFDNIDVTTTLGWKVFLEQRPGFLPMTSTADELRTYAVRAGFDRVAIHQWDDAWVAVTGEK
jgi:ubiquinone/menaquinone biosynthesis C-methylase UbiE